MPFTILFSGNIQTLGVLPSDTNFFYAVLISCFEIVSILIAKFLFFKRKRKFIITKYLKNFTPNINYKTILYLILIAILYLIDKKQLLPKDIFSEVDYDSIDTVHKSSLEIIGKWLKLIGFPVLSIFLYKKYKRASYLLVFLLFGLFGYLQIGTSRWTLIFYTIISFAFLIKIYGNKVKKMILPISTILTIIVLSISIYKFSWAVKDSDNKFIDVIVLMSDQLQPYFSGPTLVAQCIEITEYSQLSTKVGFNTFINDFMGSVPILSGNIDSKNRLNYIFNEYIFGSNSLNTSQIIPISGVGYIYFGFWFSTIFVFIATYLGLKFEESSNKSKDLINYWILIYMAIWCVSSIIFNTQILWGNIVTNYLILYIINNLINKINLKNGY